MRTFSLTIADPLLQGVVWRCGLGSPPSQFLSQCVGALRCLARAFELEQSGICPVYYRYSLAIPFYLFPPPLHMYVYKTYLKLFLNVFVLFSTVYWLPHPKQTPEFNIYPLRPELAETTYTLYRATQDPFYLHVGARMIDDIEVNWLHGVFDESMDLDPGWPILSLLEFFLISLL